MKNLLLIFWIFVLLSCSEKQKNETQSNNIENSNVIIQENNLLISENSNLDSDAGNILEEISKKLEYDNLVFNLPNIFSSWRTGNYVELPECPDIDSEEKFSTIYDLIFGNTPLNFETYPMVIKFLEEMRKICQKPNELVQIYALMGRTARTLRKWEESAEYCKNLLSITLDQNLPNYEDLREFQLNSLAREEIHSAQ